MAAFLLLGGLAASACGVKHTVKVPVAPKVASARTATLDELLALLANYERSIATLSSTGVKLSYTSGRQESGSVQEYRSAPGYVLLRRPDSLRLNIQNPVTKTSIAELASRGDEFSVWYPRENKFFTGRNSIRQLEVDGPGGAVPSFSARPIHIFDAIALRGIEEKAGFRVALEEDQDGDAKYYIVAVFRESGRTRLLPVRMTWFERSEMNPLRQKTFFDDGTAASIVTYGNFAPYGTVRLPLRIRIERPRDGYYLDLAFTSWRLNPTIPPDAFVLSPPSTAQRVRFKEKGT
jgi:outer membrane lipoprotein-sorting protein